MTLEEFFSSSDFLPRFRCGAWTTTLTCTYFTANIVICLSYIAIPVHLFLLKRRMKSIPFSWALWMFIAFILFCGIGHFLEAMTFFWPAYRFLAAWHGVTAFTSLATAIILPQLLTYILFMRKK